ncbi:MAG: mechanosensitive ion channel family protein [Acidobacteriaceae bacterium]
MIRPFRRLTSGRLRASSHLLSWAAVIVAGVLCASHGVAQKEAPPASIHPTQPTSTPQIAPPYDVAARSQAILAHLNAVVRFYRNAESPIQKVGEPSDLFYRNQVVAQATQAAGFAFQSAKIEVGILDRSAQAQTTGQAGSRAQRLQQALNSARQRIAELKARDTVLDRQVASASGKKRAQLQQQLEQVDGELDLQTEMANALRRIASMSGGAGNEGLGEQVAQLQRSAPGVEAKKATVVAPTLENLNQAHSMGVFSQARIVFSLLRTMQDISNLSDESSHLHDQATALRAPLITALKSTIAQGQAASQTAASAPATAGPKAQNPSSAAPSIGDTEKRFKDLAATFRVLSGAAVPLSQEILTLEQTQATLQAWNTAVDQEYDSLLQALLLRVLFIAIALGIILIISELWRRGTRRYVRDLRRRRQLLVLRRFITGFMVGVVLIFGLVTQFSSLATFAGLITAGIAVGLQTVLLSIAAYFFIVGRYGIKAGDRISIAGVTGDVAEVGLMRFYVMEMAGSGPDLYSTGRIAVFSNAVLFQATTPLYKQMPGTEFAWHELILKLAPDADHRPVGDVVLKAVKEVYAGYREKIEQQHKRLEAWMDSGLEAPEVLSSLQLADSGPQFSVRFPVMIRHALEVDAAITDTLLKAIAGNEQVKAAISGTPVIRAVVRR